jgi:hypothetical protein
MTDSGSCHFGNRINRRVAPLGSAQSLLEFRIVRGLLSSGLGYKESVDAPTGSGSATSVISATWSV